ncbi:MAG TPA: hypothetical protein PKE54_14450 [Candidatus Obscuribacter sp.]|nr:hypothetical protein [Candidatus Obscuribacter sp.]
MVTFHPERPHQTGEQTEGHNTQSPQDSRTLLVQNAFQPGNTLDFSVNSADATRRLTDGAQSILPNFGLAKESDRNMAEPALAFAGERPDIMQAAFRGHRSTTALARDFEGQKLWANTPYKDIVDNGEAGCAASLGVFLKAAGYRFETSPLAVGLKNNLRAAGWHPTSMDNATAGDVVYGNKIGRVASQGGGAGHIAVIVGRRGDGEVMVADNNAKEGGVWSIRPLKESFPPERYNYGRLQFLKPPGR